jgi:hypothetical protein
MTERKPLGMSFTSWIDEQIQEAAERGAFDDLPGAGKPIPNRGDEDAAQSWIREHVRKEGIPAQDLLPTPLRLRKDVAQLSETLESMQSEAAVREAVTKLNERIMQWRRLPIGPPIFVPLVDEEALATRWREAQPRPDNESPADDAPEPAGPPPTARWWRRRR